MAQSKEEMVARESSAADRMQIARLRGEVEELRGLLKDNGLGQLIAVTDWQAQDPPPSRHKMSLTRSLVNLHTAATTSQAQTPARETRSVAGDRGLDLAALLGGGGGKGGRRGLGDCDEILRRSFRRIESEAGSEAGGVRTDNSGRRSAPPGTSTGNKRSTSQSLVRAFVNAMHQQPADNGSVSSGHSRDSVHRSNGGMVGFDGYEPQAQVLQVPDSPGTPHLRPSRVSAASSSRRSRRSTANGRQQAPPPADRWFEVYLLDGPEEDSFFAADHVSGPAALVFQGTTVRVLDLETEAPIFVYDIDDISRVGRSRSDKEGKVIIELIRLGGGGGGRRKQNGDSFVRLQNKFTHAQNILSCNSGARLTLQSKRHKDIFRAVSEAQSMAQEVMH